MTSKERKVHHHRKSTNVRLARGRAKPCPHRHGRDLRRLLARVLAPLDMGLGTRRLQLDLQLAESDIRNELSYGRDECDEELPQ